MNSEMDENLSIFISEGNELLEDMESALLDLESNPNDSESMNRVFRAAHTIKGNAGLFGYDQIIDFTHIMESLLVEVRNGIVPITSDLVSLFMRSKDIITSMMDSLVGSGEVDQNDLDEATKLLEHYLADPHAAALAANPCDEDGSATQVETPTGIFTINLKLGTETFRQGFSIKAIFRELNELGVITSANLFMPDIPKLDEIDPESCHLSWLLLLESSCQKQAIADIFEFMDDCEFHILSPESKTEEYKKIISLLPNGEAVIGQILVTSGALTEKELQTALDRQKETGSRTGDILVEQGDVQPEVLESAIAKQQQTRAASSQSIEFLRVNASKLDTLINLVGELVINGERVSGLTENIDDDKLAEAVTEMNETLEEMRETALGLRIVPIDGVFKRFNRTVRDTSNELGKQINFEISGGETELDKTVAEKITDPLTHLIRNAIDHGIEKPSERELNNKPPEGHVALSAYHETGSIVIKVSDDGKGLNKEKISNKAIERGLIKQNDKLSDSEIYNLIFEPGFSTAEQVSNISGRGVGMDVVKRNIESLRGNINVESEEGIGTNVIIQLPLTLAIIDGFLICTENEDFVIPLDMVVECLRLTKEQTKEMEKHNYINLRGEVLPLIDLKKHFCLPKTLENEPETKNVIVVQHSGKKTGLLVDSLHGEVQTVIKPLGKIFQNLKGFSGFTILGSGNVSMIIDVSSLITDASEKQRDSFMNQPHGQNSNETISSESAEI
ncbi:MAG: chemotaxis protein CheA [Gammaproteobacteria bacterium]|nr:MAG: chemotaxis protein CheA [Gammaproteobacteria bacterium]